MKPLKITLMTFLLGSITTINAQRIVVIGEVKNIQEGTVFQLEETSGTSSTRLFHKDDSEDNGKVINNQFILNYKCNEKTSRHFALYSESPGFHSWVKLDFWAEQGDTVYVKGDDKILGNWEVQTQAPEQKEWDLIRKATAKECATYQQAWLDYEAYRQYRRDTEMSEAEWERTKSILAKKDTLVKQNHILWLKI